MKHRNMVGPQIRKLRYVRGWSQTVLAAKLQILGGDIDRVAVAKIESRLVHVDDYELFYFTKVFKVGLADLFPKIDAARRIHEVLTELMQRKLPKRGSSKKAAFCSQTGTVMRKTTATVAGNVREQWIGERGTRVVRTSAAGVRTACVLG
jgi:transcriptional regulator with XRE-family HTH domain